MNNMTQIASARSRFFQLLALGFSHPVVEFHSLLASGDFLQSLEEAADSGFSIHGEPAMSDGSFVEFEAAYIDLFQIGHRGKPRVHLRASEYEQIARDDSHPQILLQYSSWYKHFGLQTSEGDFGSELPDNIICQLEFMAWLAHLEAGASSKPDILEGYQRAQRDFCDRHLLPVLNLLVVSLQQIDAHFYLGLATLTAQAVEQLVAEFTTNLNDTPRQSDRSSAVNLWE
jgi:putative dimethyl sulfoxide reductase chaperone